MICFQFSYLWGIRNSTCSLWVPCIAVVICFESLSLNYWEQPQLGTLSCPTRCDLLSSLYLWAIGNSNLLFLSLVFIIVICFQICTFEPLETAYLSVNGLPILLWFAFKFVPLNHWKQPNSISDASDNGCDLLSNLYLWTIGNSASTEIIRTLTLWFAFKFVPLNHWKQPLHLRPINVIGCDLLSNLYLWTIGNSQVRWQVPGVVVVICFQICTFEPLETAISCH